MRRILASVLAIGIAGLGGMGVMRGIAQSDAPALKPETLKPTSFTAVKGAPAVAPVESGVKPDIKTPDVEPIVPPVPDALPIITPPQPTVLPPVNPGKEEKSAPLTLPMPEVVAPMPEVPAVKPPEPVKVPDEVKIPEPVKVPETIKIPDPAKVAETPASVKPDMLPPAVSSARTKPETASGGRVAPSVTIEAIAPETAPYGQPVSYEIVVRNAGSSAVTHVRVDEEITAGTKYISADPAGEINGDKVMWMLGSMAAGEEKRIKMTVKPGEGDLSSKPRVTFSASTSMTVPVTRPNLAVTVNTSDIAQVGDEVPVQIQITNKGNGDAPRVILKAVLSEGFKHSEGNDIQAQLNKLAPGESQVVTLRVQAAMAGVQTCSLIATADGAPQADAQAKVDIRQPKLTLALSGPGKCVVKAEPVFAMEVANPGTSATEPVQLAVAFPEGLDFSSASDGGAYDPATRTVSWNLGSAAAGTKRNLTVKAKSSVAGHLAVRAVAQAGTKLNARAESVIQAEGVPAMSFEVSDSEDPLEVGKEATYEIRLANTGTMHCTNVKLTAAFSDGLVPTQVSSNLPYKINGQTMVFDAVPKMAVKSDLVVRVKARGTTAGDHRFKVQLSCDQLKQPVVKEESTSFFQP